jgi:hypothetical protein
MDQLGTDLTVAMRSDGLESRRGTLREVPRDGWDVEQLRGTGLPDGGDDAIADAPRHGDEPGRQPAGASPAARGRRVHPVDHRYVVRFSLNDPESPLTTDERIALARQAARKLGIPNAESAPIYRVGRNSNTGESWAYVEWTWEGLR